MPHPICHSLFATTYVLHPSNHIQHEYLDRCKLPERGLGGAPAALGAII